MRRTLIAYMAVMTMARTSAASVAYVDDDAPVGGNGSTWNSAFRHLQDALSFAAQPGSPVTEIRIGQGDYRPDESSLNPSGTGIRATSLVIPPGMTVIGSHAGFGTPDPDAFDLDLYPSILTGDLLENDGPNFFNTDDNSHHVVSLPAGAALTTIRGVVIRDGKANVVQEQPGGGLVASNANLHMSHCLVTDNDSIGFGGGMKTSGGQLLLHDCSFIANRAGAGAAGLDAESNNQLIHDCLFQNNVANTTITSRGGGLRCSAFGTTLRNLRVLDNAAGQGAGLMFYGSGIIEDCLFENNNATDLQGGGGGISHISFDPPSRITRCTFRRNQAFFGGAIACTVEDIGVTEIANCIFSGNNASTSLGGGAIHATGFPQAQGPLPITNCTFHANTGTTSVLRTDTYSAAIRNCILWQNNVGPIGAFNPTAPNTIQHSITNQPGAGNINSDPLMVDAFGPDSIVGTSDDNLRLRRQSPALDAGNNSAVATWIALDHDSNPRFVDLPYAPDVGIGGAGGPLVDMGAFERQLNSCFADIAPLGGDHIVNVQDQLQLITSWGPCTDCPADLSPPGGDGIVNTNDLLDLISSWGRCSDS